MNKNNKSGFTVVEILVVISIIGLLSATILVGLGGLRAKGRDSRRILDLRQVQTSLELYFSKEGNYPMNVTDWSDLERQLQYEEIGVSRIARDPSNSSQEYFYGSTGNKYVLGAYLEEESSRLLNDSYGPVDDIMGSEECGGEVSTEEGMRGFYCLSL